MKLLRNVMHVVLRPLILWPLSSVIVCILGVRDGFAACVYGLLIVGVHELYEDFSRWFDAQCRYFKGYKVKCATMKKNVENEVSENEG